MMKKIILPFLVIGILIFISYGCNMRTDVISWGPLHGVYVAEASATQLSGVLNMSVFSVAIYEDNALGNSLTGAVVTMSGYPLAENTPGIYQYATTTAALFASGEKIDLNISSSKGTVSSSVNMAEKVTMDAPVLFTSVPVTSTCTIQWSYPDGVPSGSSNLTVVVGSTTLLNVTLPGATVSRLIPANTMAAPDLAIASITTKRTAVITGATEGSALFTSGSASATMFSTVP